MPTIEPQKGPQTRFLSSSADIVLYGGAAGGGKSFALLLEPLRHIHNPGFRAVVFRRTSPQITAGGGLWDTAGRLYPACGGVANQSALKYRFPSGAEVKFTHIKDEKTKYDHDGSQYAFIGFDELIHFTRSQFFYLLSRNRSMCGVRPYIRATCNPDSTSWVKQFIAWWLDPATGLSIPERDGVLRWFVVINDEPIFFDSEAEAKAAHPDIPPKSLTFIAAKLSDNAILCEQDPGYKANLMALSWVERARLLGGNWNASASDGLFQADWFGLPVKPEHAPVMWKRKVRSWDLACLVAGTMVETSTGPKPIEQIQIGEYVLTRQGYKRVLNSWLTKYVDEVESVTFTNGASLTGTADHRVWTNNRGWVPLGLLDCGDDVTTLRNLTCPSEKTSPVCRTRKQLSSTGLFTPVGPAKSISRHGDGTRRKRKGGLIHYTEPFGVSISGRSPTGMTYTTRTTTTTIKTLATLSCLPEANTQSGTIASHHSTALRHERNTKPHLLRHLGRRQPTRITPANNAGKCFNHDGLDRLCIAQSDAVGWQAITDTKNATGQAGTWLRKLPVYDLEVEDAHEFFANGVLVHNCTEQKDSNDPDWLASVLMGEEDTGKDDKGKPNPPRYWILDAERHRISPLKVKRKILEVAMRDGEDVEVVLEQEAAASGKVLASEFRELLQGLRDLDGQPKPAFKVYIYKPDKTTGDKATRAFPFSASCERGEVKLVAGAWVKPFLGELCQFPTKGVHDDWVDAGGAAHRRLSNRGGVLLV